MLFKPVDFTLLVEELQLELSMSHFCLFELPLEYLLLVLDNLVFLRLLAISRFQLVLLDFLL